MSESKYYAGFQGRNQPVIALVDVEYHNVHEGAFKIVRTYKVYWGQRIFPGEWLAKNRFDGLFDNLASAREFLLGVCRDQLVNLQELENQMQESIRSLQCMQVSDTRNSDV